MPLENGYIKLHRKILNWRWYKKPSTKQLFIHLLLIANIDDRDFENITVHRGECVSSIRGLACDTGLTEREVRTALKHLKETQEVTQTAYPKFSVFTVNNYELYQAETQTMTSNRHADDTQVTSKRHHNKKDNKDKNDKKDNNIESNPAPLMKSFGEYNHVKLTEEQYNKLVAEYGKNIIAECIRKVDEYCQQHGKTYKDYNLTIRKWIAKDTQNKHTPMSAEDYTSGLVKGVDYI